MKYLILFFVFTTCAAHWSSAQNPTPPPPPAAKPSTTDSDIVDFPDKDAQFRGKTKGLQRYISSTVKYPEEAIEKNLSGKVYLSFIVEIDGSVSNITVEKGVHPLLDSEAVRVIRQMPKWKPGKLGSTKVRTRCRIPIVFTLA